jgi:hypothetical protein
MQTVRAFDDLTRKLDDFSVDRRNACQALSGVGGCNMKTIVLILAMAMVAPLPFEEVVGGYGRLALAVLGFLLIFWWLFKNDQKKDLRGEL